MQEQLERVRWIAWDNLEEAQASHKHIYDLNTWAQELQKGDLVLVMLPDHTSKLVSKWQEPFRVRRKVEPTNYERECPGSRSSRQVYHVTILKRWEMREKYLMNPQEVPEEWTQNPREAKMNPN